jgi:PAS domain S-box-containing protein
MSISSAVINPGDLLDQLTQGVIVVGPDWRVLYANQTIERGMGRPREQILGQHLLVLAAEFCKEDSCGDALRLLTRLATNPTAEPLVKRLPFHTPGRRRFVRVRAQPYPLEGSEPGHLFFLRDATEEGEIDEKKNEFVSMASHEMRTPMTSIKGSLELLLGGYAGELPAEATELLGISLTAVDRLVRLVNDLLDISKIESGKMELHLDRLVITECVSKSVRSLRALAEAHKVSIRAVQPEGGVLAVVADRDRIEQVITNLLSNALKYTPPESEVRVETLLTDDKVRISVCDQGPGIAPEHLEKVFDRFCQLAGAKKGSGLGLTICRALVEQHGGRIWVESELGHGARFHVEIPAAPSE